jgi:5'-nucleotidase|tara:strand:- start:2163 stop:4655 length:2493 start_codon:yes stop_codon:yes gene_type:complete
MNKKMVHKPAGLSPKNVLRLAVILVVSIFLSGCYTVAAVRDFERAGGTAPWWCKGTPDLTQEECIGFSLQLDIAERKARKFPTLADFELAGAEKITASMPVGTGEAYSLAGVDTATFTPTAPQALLYDGTGPEAQLVGVMWIIDGALPNGFPGDRDQWISTGPSQWALPAWIIRGYQNQPNVFAASHPCLEVGVVLGSTLDACYLEAHPVPFEILVTNDDGLQAPGIDALAQALIALNNTEIHVVAPAESQSGAGGATTPAPYVVSGAQATTSSGIAATAVYSTDPADAAGSASPADAAIFALTDPTQLLSPEVVISGINSGQNYSGVVGVSGTIGAARAARSNGVAAIATSQGFGTFGAVIDYPAGVIATLALLEDWRLGRTVNTVNSVLNINTPTCINGNTVNGAVYTKVKPILEPGDAFNLQDCASVEPVENISNDLEAFNNGFIGITDINRTDSLKVSSYNMGLAQNFVPFTQERLVANEALLADYESDVICFQEVWLEDSVTAVEAALGGSYPHRYKVPAEQVFSAGAACTLAEITPLENCANTNCTGLSGTALVSCVTTSCVASFPAGACLDGVIGAVGLPGVTVEQVVEVVTQPAGKFAFGGSTGLMLASKYELKNREFQDFIDDSTGNHRGALYAEILLNGKNHVVGCTHPTANLEGTLAYPDSGNFTSWEAENRFMQQEMISFVNAKAGSKPIFFGGDFNCSIANASTSVDEEFPDNCQLWLDDGFIDPAAAQLPCTYCETENLVLQPGAGTGASLLDHIFVKNLGATATASIVAERVFDDPVNIIALDPVSELQLLDSPMVTHPSDHFGVELLIDLPLRP